MKYCSSFSALVEDAEVNTPTKHSSRSIVKKEPLQDIGLGKDKLNTNGYDEDRLPEVKTTQHSGKMSKVSVQQLQEFFNERKLRKVHTTSPEGGASESERGIETPSKVQLITFLYC